MVKKNFSHICGMKNWLGPGQFPERRDWNTGSAVGKTKHYR